MFQFITISSGVAVVQNETTGHVYRFRPLRPGVWSWLVLDEVDPSEAPQEHVCLARGFAEEEAAAFCRTAFDPGMPSRHDPGAWTGDGPNGSC